ncbi:MULTISPECIES: NUDIX hydrolase [Pseudomonas]|uniref:NUDIX hydrolase n=1 Tax=Pseudomonas donghuensis TaxID=1163398 RepID=A0AAP0SEY3_9PSED|nr:MULTISPECIES: NUDIX hydrolase [Pseudomonas]MDF9895540.1 8-oxo-dGTP diphosphatase [Pseudomonas vranovensis]KDN97201.2 NUDIX hydrolase [Pseudomonas donghuensis]MBS7597989.1 NUDIX hydrolase [Pseudomonas sp. RC2C2]MCP6692795.1 NUDIX hydrolase [Pseudomonas donghuensis]MCP6698833.1 NUDIX hydrolase [Pseudomonas donghuensis]
MTWIIPQASAYGGVLLNSDGQVLLREPANHHDGYVWTFAKARPLADEEPEQTAVRAVRVDAGHEGKVIGVLPGLYEGGTSKNAFFLMISGFAHGPTGGHTQNTCWASFEHARELIGKTTNPIGRTRDLQVLEATQRWLASNRKGVVAFEQQGSKGWAVKGNWLTKEMPEQFVTLSLDFVLDAEEACAIRKGFIPSEMEEKWFSYYVDDVLYQHRSWTGVLVDRIRFVDEADGIRAIQADVNRDQEQYSQMDDAQDIRRIESMVRNLASRNRLV